MLNNIFKDRFSNFLLGYVIFLSIAYSSVTLVAHFGLLPDTILVLGFSIGVVSVHVNKWLNNKYKELNS